MALHAFHGGLRLPGHKTHAGAIRPGPVADTLWLPLQQHAGAANRPLVSVGERVNAGQAVAAPDNDDGRLGAWLHAPCDAEVVAIEDRELPSNPAIRAPTLVLRRMAGSDAGADAGAASMPPIADWCEQPSAVLLQRLAEAGVAGLGGAVFPSADKLSVRRQTLIVNGAECEPYIACDDALLRERSDRVIHGALLLAHIAGAEHILLAIEDRMQDALAAAATAIANHGDERIELRAVPTIYPEGGERQLIQTLTGKQVPRGGLPRDIGVIVQNVGTAAAAWAAVVEGRPLTTRLVSVAGDGVRAAGTFEVAIGTPVSEVVAAAGGYSDRAARLIIGGPMMGVALPHDEFPITKAANCVLVPSEAELGERRPEMPCIRCGECAKACPADLQPFELYWFSRAKNFGKAQEYHLFDCIECGCCSYVCPSHIRLVDYYRFAKSEIWARERDKDAADAARERFDFRNLRQEREKQEKAARLAAKAAETRAKLAGESGDDDKTTSSAKPSQAEEAKKALIAAALEKARQQKERAPVPPRNTDNLSADKQAEIDAIEARRAAARQEAE